MGVEKRSCDKAVQKMMEHMSEAGVVNTWGRVFSCTSHR